MNESVGNIVSAFIGLLREKPYNKITVKDICSRSFVHRNTFYYHFQDMSELLQYTISCQEDIILDGYKFTGSPLDFLEPISEYAMERKELLNNLYQSQGKEYIYMAIRELTSNLVHRYVEESFDKQALDPTDQEVIARYYASVSSGLITDWLASNFSYDLMADVRRVYELLGIDSIRFAPKKVVGEAA